MKGFLPDGVFNPFDTVFPDNPGLADLALVNMLNKNEKQQNRQQQNTPGGGNMPPFPGGKLPWEP